MKMKKVNFEVLIKHKIMESEFKFFKWLVFTDPEIGSFEALAEIYKKGYDFNDKWIYYNKLKITFEAIGLKDLIMTKKSLIIYESILYYERYQFNLKYKPEHKYEEKICVKFRLEKNDLDELLGMRISNEDFEIIEWLLENDPKVRDIEDLMDLFEIDGYDFHKRKLFLLSH